MQTKDILISGFVITLIMAAAWLWFSPAGLQQAPAIKLKIVDGRTVDLARLRGQPVLVSFWATSCPGCVKEIPHLIELYKELAPRGLEVIGISMAYDPPNYVMEMRKKRQIPYPIALDINSEAASAFGDVRLTPTTFLIDPQGHIVQKRIGELDIHTVREKILAMLSTASKSAQTALSHKAES